MEVSNQENFARHTRCKEFSNYFSSVRKYIPLYLELTQGILLAWSFQYVFTAWHSCKCSRLIFNSIALSIMNESTSLYVGIAAGICTAVSLLPQLFKIVKKKKADDLSWFMLFILLIGIGGWIWYGILKKDYPIIITNAFSFIVNILIIGFSLAYKKKQ